MKENRCNKFVIGQNALDSLKVAKNIRNWRFLEAYLIDMVSIVDADALMLNTKSSTPIILIKSNI